MVPLKAVTVILLVHYVQLVERSESKRIVVSEEGISDYTDLDFQSICCTFGHCVCQSFLHALTNLTDNVTITITTDVMLSSAVFIVGVDNTRVVGYNKLTVHCNNTGGLKFISCKNITIEGISWEGCGFNNKSDTDPVLGMYNSSGITIQNCTFHNSIGQAVVLSNVMGNVIINSCMFTNNTQYRGHGVAVYYPSGTDTHVLFTIDNCSFTDNGRAESVVYIRGYKLREAISLHNSMFVNNHGVPLYISYQVVHIRGNLLVKSNDNGGIFSTNNSYILFTKHSHASFYNNKAELGGAIYSNDNVNMSFEENSTVTFTENYAEKKGGAIFSNDNANMSFEENSVVIFIENNAKRDGGAIYCSGTSNILFKGTVKFIKNSAQFYGGAVYSHDNSSILFTDNSTITVVENNAKYGGAIYSLDNSKTIFEESSVVIFAKNNARWNGGAINSGENSGISIKENSTVTFTENSAGWYGGAIYLNEYSSILFENISTVSFTENNASWNGGALYSIVNSSISFEGNSLVNFTKNYARWHGGVIYSNCSSKISFEGKSTVLFTKNSAKYYGGSIYSNGISIISFKEKCTATFIKNSAIWSGGAIFSAYKSKLSCEKNSTVTFTKNYAKRDGGALYSIYSSIISFHGNSTMTFTDNMATRDGGAIYTLHNSNVLFKDNCIVSFTKNKATRYGGAIHSIQNSNISFEMNSVITFNENSAIDGGAIHIASNVNPLFQENCTVSFTENKAIRYGGAIYSTYNSNTLFDQSSKVAFTENIASEDGGAIYSYNSSILFKDYCIVVLAENIAMRDGGAICTAYSSNISFEGNSKITFTENTAGRDSGAIFPDKDSNIIFSGNSEVDLLNNTATRDGGAICHLYNTVTFQGYVTVMFVDNKASRDGGAINSYLATVVFKDHCKVIFSDNYALRYGGGVYSLLNSIVLCIGSSTVEFTRNEALSGGALCSEINSSVVYKENTTVRFQSNVGKRQGGAIYNFRNYYSHDGYSKTTYTNNYATFGGAVYSDGGSNLVGGGNSVVEFINNKAVFGGAIYAGGLANSLSIFNESSTYFNAISTFEGNSTVIFMNNVAISHGGAIFALQSNIKCGKNRAVIFQDNTAQANGGAIYLSDQSTTIFANDSDLTFSYNTAEGYGGAIFIRITESVIAFNTHFNAQFHNNSAKVAGNLLYITVPKWCDRSCLDGSIMGIENVLQSSQDVAVTPHTIELYHPAVCISYNTEGDCRIYFVRNTMLGQEISIDACVLDYYGQHCNAVQFIVSGENNNNYSINGENYVFISCGNSTFQGISIIGNETFPAQSNYSITLKLNVGPYSDEKAFSNTIVVEISPCHPGFWHDKKLQRCVCYNDTDIVFCSDSSSTIKRGYWFGIVNRQPTVTVCPVNYCDFTCCETTDGFYHLSPSRENQCRSHRTGIACGNCEEGWALSFDSAECIHINQCTAGQTALIVALTSLYWLGVLSAAFFIMYYKVPVGYLYAISYYYSMMDVWLSQTLHLSQSLLITFNALSSIVKVTPQFLGQLCLIKNMSGIDQQFIHYIHPVAITLILIAISLVAKVSYRFSSFISRGIIRVICLLLLLSYTSITTTSLMLMRVLTFVNVHKVYTYLSPDIEYFHGRHLPYGIVAVFFAIVIVIGLPLLLLLEPFLNSFINFTRIKPLLDQFQGCYKDRYRSMASYYMICRLVIIVVFIAGSSNASLAHYILIVLCVIASTIHLMVRPYHYKKLNIFDGLILMLINFVTVLPLFDTLNSNIVVGIAFTLMILPLVMFLVMVLLLCKEKLKKALDYCSASSKDDSSENAEVPMSDIGLVIDDSMRIHATICEM